MKPSTARVLALLRERGPAGVTDLEALRECHTTRLAARIHDLRTEGYVIGSKREREAGATYARYVIHEEPVQMEAFG